MYVINKKSTNYCFISLIFDKIKEEINNFQYRSLVYNYEYIHTKYLHILLGDSYIMIQLTLSKNTFVIFYDANLKLSKQ